MKRELGSLSTSGEIQEGSRPKRRREAGGSSSDVDIAMGEPAETSAASGGVEVKEQGMKIWQAVKDAVNKEGRILSEPFLQKPPKRKYPDYYVIIQQPIALDDIKKRLDNNQYSSLEGVKQDFELLFNNAKQYNLPDSQIFIDAKDLLKLVHKTYNKFVPNDEDAENGQPKAPNLTRLIKTRLDKLTAKTDAFGRILSTEFMQLPSRKIWAIYYKEIKQPQCFDNIFKKIKRKDYHTSAEFAADVELIFSNALQFNQEHTQIWEDAVTLRDYFRQLMSDLPAPYNLPEYSKPSNKIKIKPPQSAQATKSSTTAPASKQESGSSSLLLRVPAPHPPKPSSPPKSAAKPKPASPPKNVAAVPAAPPPEPTLPVAPVRQPPKQPAQPAAAAPVRTVTPRVAKAATPHPPPPAQPAQQTISFVNATPAHYPRAPYVPPPSIATAVSAPAPLPAPAAAAALRPSSALNVAHSTSQSPAPPVLSPNHQLKSINLRIDPKGRKLGLDHRDGVKSWALRLLPGETSVYLSNVCFLGDEEEEEHSSEEEEEEDMDMDVDVEAADVSPSKSANGRRKGKGRGRGRPPKAAVLAAKAAQAAAAAKAAKIKKKAATKVGEVQLKLNKFQVKEQPEKPGEWSVYLPVGSNVIEIGEVGGMVWKIYAERLGDA
ncbi:hypothetical protein D9613_004216 [Agrocybe pediades]|uniref:Bromo domain-containing protein n=1 Tax=Agrocybe pediades TaxID=84607 RepID=A0A8H4VIM0_9AGAR|nr:hypothetical protein D9613_004216 [Agrocybe pediades]